MNRFSQATLDFIARASRQKRPEWLDKNRAEYEDVLLEPAKALVERVSRNLRKEAGAYRFPRQVARIRRSVDRAREQGWYKDWIGVSVSRDSGSMYDDLPGLYFHISAEDVFSAGGLYMASSRQVKQIRAWIDHDASALERLLEDREFARIFKDGLGDERKLKTKPRDYPIDHPRIEWLKLTGYYVWRPFTKRQVFSKDFADILSDDWRQVLRLNAVLDRYLARWPGKIGTRSRLKLDELGDLRRPEAQF